MDFNVQGLWKDFRVASTWVVPSGAAASGAQAA